jgi:hypothetical protein
MSFEDISISSNGSDLGWRLQIISDKNKILKGDHPRIS